MSANYEILSKVEVSGSEVLDSINTQEKDAEELTYREEKVQEYLKKNIKLSLDDFKKVKEEIEKLEIPRLEEMHIIKIIDLMPRNGTELRSVVSNSGVILVDENSAKILDVLKPYQN